MEHKLHSAGGAADQLGQLGLSEMDLLKLAASGTLGQHGYNTRSHSAEVAHHPQHPGIQPTYSPSWPPHGLGGSSERDAAAAAALAAAHAGHHPLMPPGGAYFPSASLSGGAAGLGAHGSLGGSADLTYLAQLGAVGTSGALLAGAAASSAAFGEGPRIYVGGVPDLVTVAMVRDHFSRWGVVRDVHFPKERTSRRRRHFCFVTFESMQAAERAVAESNREIGGYPVAAINIPTDRLTHYGLRQDLHACLRGEHLSQASALASPTAALRSSLPFGAGSPGALSAGVGPLGGAPGDAYASPTRVQSHSGIYGNVAHQVGAHRIRGTTSADFAQQLSQLSQPDMTAAAQHLAGGSEADLAAALATLRLTQQQQAAATAAANGYGSGSGSSTRQTSYDFSVGRSSQEYGNHLGAGMLGMGMGGSGAGSLSSISTAGNPAAGGDIYTVLANMQRTSLSAQQQQRNSPQPGAHMSLLHGGSVSAGGTPLGTPPGNGFHSGAATQRPGSAQGGQHTSQPQPSPPASSSFNFLSQGQQQQQLQGMPHQRSSSFSGASGGLPPHPDYPSTRSHSAAIARSASPLARISSGVPGLPGLPTDMRAMAAYHANSPAPSVGDATSSISAPATGAAPGAGSLLQGGQQQYSVGMHEQYLASLRASLPAAVPQQQQEQQQDGSQHGGQQLPASLPNMPRPPSRAKDSEPVRHQDSMRASLDNSALGDGVSHLRGGGGSASADDVSTSSPGAQHRNASAADVTDRFASADSRSQPQQHTEQQKTEGPHVAKEGNGHGPPLESKGFNQEASGGTDDSASLDARMSASVADLLRGSSGSLSHMLHQQQAQQSQGQQLQNQYTGDSRQSWDAGSNGSRVPQQAHLPQPPPRTPSSWVSNRHIPFFDGFNTNVAVSTRGT